MELNSYVIAMYMIISNIQSVIHTLLKPFIIGVLFFTPYNIYYINKRENRNIISNKIKSYTAFAYDDNSNPIGYLFLYNELKKICGCMYISCNTYEGEIAIITTSSYLKYLLSNETLETTTNKDIVKMVKYQESNTTNKVKLCIRMGDYTYIDYRINEVQLRFNSFNKQQDRLFHRIIKVYETKSNTTCYLYGDRGKGKTFFAYLMAQYMNATLCKTYNPCEPGNNFCVMYSRILPSKQSPLILLLDEVDILLEKVHHNKVVLHKNIPTEIFDKSTWNSFFDEFDYGIYKNVIILLNSNKPKLTIDNYDKSYLRKGRIDIISSFI